MNQVKIFEELENKNILYKNRETVLKLIKDERARQEGIADYVEGNGFHLWYVDDCYGSDREIVLNAVKHDAWNLNDADDKFKKDKEILEIAIRGGFGLDYANKNMLQDRELIL